MKKEILKISIRQNAIYIPKELIANKKNKLNETTMVLVANATKLGFSFSEKLLNQLNNTGPQYKLEVLETLKELTGVHKNWTPLVKGWNVPTDETLKDHIVTFFANIFKDRKGTTLSCGHLIPENTFPLDRYNGCPYCGTPFEFGNIEYNSNSNKLKVLDVWTDNEVQNFSASLLNSKTALDATQVDSLKTVLSYFSLPREVTITMKETLMLVIDVLIDNDKEEEIQKLFKNPNDILRYLWYKHTGLLQVIKPKTIVARTSVNNNHITMGNNTSVAVKLKAKTDLKLKYSRKECRRVALWLTNLDMDAERACEIMHPKRGMWIRLIRALRLAEYSKKTGFEKLANLLDIFYNELYQVWEGQVSYYRLRYDADKTFELLKQRPGLFARSLFANMLWFGADITLTHFAEITDKIPARLLFTLNMYAEVYFNKNTSRSVKPLGGVNKRIPANKFLNLYDDEQLKEMCLKIEALCLTVVKKRFSNQENTNERMYIEENLYKIPVSIGNRSAMVQDLPAALMGTRFPIEGNTIRLFMQWGNGLPEQHLDMDLSCKIAYANSTAYCSYAQLVVAGCKHSGDIINIPNKVGTAEYIDIDIVELEKREAKYVSFTCNAYSSGSISPDLVVGWMDSKYPMRISKNTGVAYDPATVQHQVRVTQGLTKGLVFGVLDIENREVIWLEMSFGGQVVQNLDVKGVEALLAKLDSKLNIGNLLQIKAEAQGLEVVDSIEAADEIYDVQWAMNTAAVTQLLLD